MYLKILLCYFLCVTLVSANDSPVIGILAQEYQQIPSFRKAFPNGTSYIASSYVKQVEASGARVVPILIGKDREYYAKVLSQVNGVVLPGGSSYFNATDGYAEAGTLIYRMVEKMNEQGERVPILAVCLGFELLVVITSNKDFRAQCDVHNVNLKLKYLPPYKNSSLFEGIPRTYLRSLSKKNLTHNNHIWCILREDMTNLGQDKFWSILSMSRYGKWNFVSSIEHRNYPFAGIQFHPEKNAFEWTESQHNDHSEVGIQSARYFYDWLIKKARLNNHKFESKDALYKSLIQNYQHHIVYPNPIGFEQIYIFN